MGWREAIRRLRRRPVAVDHGAPRTHLSGIARALTFYGGVPQLIVPDNPRAMIADPDRYEPRAGDTVLDFARHYGTSFQSTDIGHA